MAYLSILSPKIETIYMYIRRCIESSIKCIASKLTNEQLERGVGVTETQQRQSRATEKQYYL